MGPSELLQQELPPALVSTPARPVETVRLASTEDDRRRRLCRVLLWVNLYLFVVLALLGLVVDPDLWWHLRTGQWIDAHGAVPQTDPFSSYGMGKPWLAYSWLFEVIVYGLYAQLGLVGVIVYRVLLSVGIVAAVQQLGWRRGGPFLSWFGTVALAVVALVPILGERSLLFSILGFALTLLAVRSLREGRNSRLIWLLPLVYVLWANWHIQFIYGLFVLGLACAAPVAERLLGRSDPFATIRAGAHAWWQLVGLSAACLLATLANPYHVRLYPLVLEFASQRGFYDFIQEMQAPQFRDLGDWALLALTVGTAFALGRSGKLSLFEVLLFAVAAFSSFRCKRDIWLVILTDVVLLARCVRSGWLGQSPARSRLLAPASMALLLVTFVGVVLATRQVGQLSQDQLGLAVEATYPVKAVAYVQQQGYRGRLYNRFDWGGYLLWRLAPEVQVCVDNRGNVHGDGRIDRIRHVWFGYIDWHDDPDSSRRIVLGRAGSPLVRLLRLDARSPFQMVYEDDVAVVFVRKRS